MLGGFLGNATDLPVCEHATGTHGVTLINFALLDLVGRVLSPRIRDLGKITMVRDGTPAETGKAAALKEWGTLRRTIHAAKYLSDPR